MRFRRSTAYLMVGAAVLAGCRSNGDVDGLIRENQQREEFALQLQVQLDQCCRELRATREQLAAKEQQSTGGSRKIMGDDGSPSDVKPPKVDLGPPGKTPTPAPKLEPAPKFEPGKAGPGKTGAEKASTVPETTTGPELGQMHSVATRRGEKVAAITINRHLTSGYDADESRPGDEGLVVVVEPRNLGGEVVRVAGEVSIMAFDANLWRQYASQPAKRQLAHVGTWLFTAADAETWFDEGEPRLRFELPWPAAGGPKSKDLQLIVRFKTAEGRTLEAQTQVAVQLIGRRPKPPAPTAPPTAATRAPPSASPSAPATGSPSEFSALKKPAPAVSSSPAPTTLPHREDVAPKEVSDARSDTEVPSRQRPVWSPYR